MITEKAYMEHLYTEGTEGYIELTHDFKRYKMINYYSLNEIERFYGLDNVFISPNTFYIKKRLVRNIRHLRALYIDLDLDLNRISKAEAVYKVFILAEEGKIPRPTLVVDSGRGIHLYWRIQNAPYAALYTWQQLEDYLYNNLKHLWADRSATDAARLLRLPNTINSRNGALCRILYMDNDLIYNMYDLREEFLGYRKESSQRKKSKNKEGQKVKITNFFNSYSLHLARVDDIETLCQLRNWDMRGYRNKVLHCWIYWCGIYVRDLAQLEKMALEFNNTFLEPLDDQVVGTVVTSCDRAIESFLEYHKRLTNKESLNNSKSILRGTGYNYRNRTLIDMLDITEEEQRRLKTIIDTNEKYRRKNLRRTPRNENGLTKRQQQKQENIKAVKQLADQGLKQREIAKELDITQARVSQILNNKI
ncbi:conserved hypothetical protein [[Clostridium] ultunense Esp]|nr:conserved hypothetical protein [[Clostridium] ultunense Esp]